MVVLMISPMWMIPAGSLETLYYAVVIWICWRFNRDLHRNPFEKFSKEIYVKSDTIRWEGWTKIR